jgi:signal transduction histidine kinase
MNDDDMYVTHQTLAALVTVLLHDLRNPLHSGALLVEAMASRTADLETLRGKLRAQFNKLDALISEASGPIRDLTLETRAESHTVDSIARSIARALDEAGGEAHLALPPASGLTVFVDALLLVRAVVELSATIVERQTGRPGPDGSPTTVSLRVVEPDADTVRLDFGDFAAQLEGAAAKAPFAIAGGGVRLALARALSQSAGASLRLEHTPQGLSHFAIYAPKAAPPSPSL